jgi:hypothetical protein
MRRLLIVSVIAAAAGLIPAIATAGNQEVAEKIAASLRDSGQLADFRISVKYQDGTAWLRGRVADEEQRNRALRLAFQAPGVVRVVNDIKVGDEAADATPMAGTKSKAANPLRKMTGDAQSAVATESQYSTKGKYAASSKRATPVAMMQAIPQPPRQPATLPAGETESGMTAAGNPGAPLPMYAPGVAANQAPAQYNQPCMPNYAWPSYAAYPNYAAVTYPKQYSPTAWPYIGPFYPYPQVPLGWRKVSLQWDDGWWFLDFKDEPSCCWWR